MTPDLNGYDAVVSCELWNEVVVRICLSAESVEQHDRRTGALVSVVDSVPIDVDEAAGLIDGVPVKVFVEAGLPKQHSRSGDCGASDQYRA